MQGTFTSLPVFHNYIKYLKNNFNLISVSQAMDLLDTKSVDDRYACITFDDGDISIETIIPHLISNNIPASFYLNSAYIDSDQVDPFRIANYLVRSKSEKVNLCEISRLTNVLRRTLSPDDYNYTKNRLLELSCLMPSAYRSNYVTFEYLFNTDSDLINYGLHGHEHDRFILLSRDQQKSSLERNIEFVSKLPGYIPIFAIPFGRPKDWSGDTIQVCNDLGLRYLFANGGFNNGDAPGLKRIPADNRNLIFDLRIGYYQ